MSRIEVICSDDNKLVAIGERYLDGMARVRVLPRPIWLANKVDWRSTGEGLFSDYETLSRGLVRSMRRELARVPV